MRIISIDFLRGVAVLLVVFRHITLEPILLTVGWAGVDLFFVLSGFLVSNLLFQEYKQTQSVKPIRFLIRRGFKIYPLFYLIIILDKQHFIEQTGFVNLIILWLPIYLNKEYQKYH